MTYYYDDVVREASYLLKGRAIDWQALSSKIRLVMDRKRRRPATARTAALVAIELMDTRERRLSHRTGAVDWRDI